MSAQATRKMKIVIDLLYHIPTAKGRF